jgi:hypothetical protein
MGFQHMGRCTVYFGENSHGLNAHFPAGADNTDGNFTPVGYENFFKHTGKNYFIGWLILKENESLSDYQKRF